MIKILPSLLASDLLNMGRDAARMLDAGADELHVDVMDAHFVPNLSFGPDLVRALRRAYPDTALDVHLMMDNPGLYIEAFALAGASAITVHQEIPGGAQRVLADIRARGLRAGVSVKPGTAADSVYPLLPLCDLVLVMTVEPGFGGQKFMPAMMDKIRALRGQGYAGVVMVDGGINASTARLAVQAGADALVMGTALLKDNNPEEVIAACRALPTAI